MNWLFWLPFLILGFLLLVLLLFLFLGRFRRGKYLRPVIAVLSKIPFMRRMFEKASMAALERENPELANAVKKMQIVGAPKTPEQAQKALSLLTPSERKAYLEAAGEQKDAMPEPTNRQQRRMMEKGVKPGQPITKVRPTRGKKQR